MQVTHLSSLVSVVYELAMYWGSFQSSFCYNCNRASYELKETLIYDFLLELYNFSKRQGYICLHLGAYNEIPFLKNW